MDQFVESLRFFHQFVGYPTAFLIGPMALFSFKGSDPHRLWGKAYLICMTTLYLTGTFMTFYHHEFWSWQMARNLTFNFFGYAMLLYAYRAIWLVAHGGAQRPGALDWFMAGVLAVLSVSMLVVGLSDLPMLVFGILGVILSVVEFNELLRSFGKRVVLLHRHIRYMFCSYFYVLTVISIVQTRLEHNPRWLWPTFFAVPVVLLSSHTGHRILRATRIGMTKLAIRTTVVVSYSLGLYVLYRLIQFTNRALRVFVPGWSL